MTTKTRDKIGIKSKERPYIQPIPQFGEHKLSGALETNTHCAEYRVKEDNLVGGVNGNNMLVFIEGSAVCNIYMALGLMRKDWSSLAQVKSMSNEEFCNGLIHGISFVKI